MQGKSTDEVRRAAAFRVALREFARESEHVARKARLTPQRYLLLLLVKGAEDGTGRATISELCRRLHLAQSTVTELVNRAAEAGLVRRRASANDRRVVYVEVTGEGDRRFAEAFEALAGERRTLRKFITKL
ncbi:MAG TPA: MarR family transcriptional regulator [Gaiellaceae bacterium]|nr:MarR family transcriptional regulator [Gaiellaceae bacterium]